ncbi:MAG: hypothetical protein K8T26_12345 [Lentisphaerae bacterium]|nr:hypothetical protein [Lentisphaerota bacterium]
MNTASEPRQFERRWPVALAIGTVVLLLTFLQGRVRLFPPWLMYATGILLVSALVPVGLASVRERWLGVERAVMTLFVVVVGVGNLATLAEVVRMMMHGGAELGGLQLLASSVAVWVNNVLAFSLLYWQIDRGGPESRLMDSGRRADWLFPQMGAAEHVPPGWNPTFVDYLYLGYSTATAFSTTEVAPLTSRAKLLMMAESTIALITLVVVASRAINILGS